MIVWCFWIGYIDLFVVVGLGDFIVVVVRRVVIVGFMWWFRC